MTKKIVVAICVAAIFCSMALSAYCQAQEKETFGSKFKTFWENLFKYPVNVATETANVVGETGKGMAQAVSGGIERGAEVSRGDVGKSKEMVVEPLEGTGQTVKTTVEDAVQIPFKAATKK